MIEATWLHDSSGSPGAVAAAPWTFRARLDSAPLRVAHPLSPGWTRARPLGTIYRALSSADRAFSHRPHPPRPCIGMGRKRCTILLPALLCRFPVAPGHLERLGGGHPGMVPGTQRRILRTAGYPAHVGRGITRSRLLALLDAAWLLPRSTGCLSTSIAGHRWTCVVDRLSRRPAIARRKSPHRTHAGSIAKTNWTLVWLDTTPPIESCLFLRSACGAHLHYPLRL